YLTTNHNETEQIPAERTLSIEEIDQHIHKLEILINDAITKFTPVHKQTDYLQKYTNNKIKKLHKQKSKLITILFNRQKNNAQHVNERDTRVIKEQIAMINKCLKQEFRTSTTAYWEAIFKGINHRKADEFFPKINYYLRRKKTTGIDNLIIKTSNRNLNTNNLPSTAHNSTEDIERIITEPVEKLDIIGKHFETINSPRYTNVNSEMQRIANDKTEQIYQDLELNRNLKRTFTTFNSNNTAHFPHQDE
ncbi:hypothetical protein PV326_001982, partial [Microctonus aethiopoides]